MRDAPLYSLRFIVLKEGLALWFALRRARTAPLDPVAWSKVTRPWHVWANRRGARAGRDGRY